MKIIKTFKEIKFEFEAKCKAASACATEFKRVLLATNELELLKVIADNIYWCYADKKIIDTSFFEQFESEILEQSGFIISGFREVLDIKIIALGNSTVKAFGSSTVKAFGSSTVKAFGSSTVEAYDSSTVEAYDSSTVEAYDSSTVEAFDSSTVKAYDSSTLYSQNDITNHSIQERVIMRKGGKLYIKKGEFEIIEL